MILNKLLIFNGFTFIVGCLFLWFYDEFRSTGRTGVNLTTGAGKTIAATSERI